LLRIAVVRNEELVAEARDGKGTSAIESRYKVTESKD
jgi:hypothetical protein